MASRSLAATIATIALPSVAILANQFTVVEDRLWAAIDLDMWRDRATNEVKLVEVTKAMIDGRQGWTSHMFSSYHISVRTWPDWDEESDNFYTRQSTMAIRQRVHPLGWLVDDRGLDPEVFRLGVLYSAMEKKETLDRVKKNYIVAQREYDFMICP